MNKEKIEKFMTAYGELVKEHGVDFVNYPMFIPDGQGGFKIICQTQPVDMDDMKIPASDFIPNKK